MSRAGHACNPACEPRKDAQATGEFVFLVALNGWVFPDGPKRRASVITLVKAQYGKAENWTGFPYIYDCCPWCGGDLSAPDMGEGDEA